MQERRLQGAAARGVPQEGARARPARREPRVLRRKEEPQRLDVPGAILRASLDPDTWLTSGYGTELPVLVNPERIYLAPKGPANSGKRVAARYATKDRLRISGHIWPETLERLPETVFAYEERIGQGRVIAFAEDLNFRGFWRGADRLFLNAVVVGPSAP